MNLGLIALLFPNVPIIHCKRDAMDNCLSIFFQYFGGAHPYAYDLANVGHHYKAYERMMAHWHEVLPGRILDINYEDTIADRNTGRANSSHMWGWNGMMPVWRRTNRNVL